MTRPAPLSDKDRQMAWDLVATMQVSHTGSPKLWRAVLEALTEAEADADRLAEALLAVRTELDRWGYGDFHYGNQPRDKRVLAGLAVADVALAAHDERRKT